MQSTATFTAPVMTAESLFHSSYVLTLNPYQIVEEISRFIAQDPKYSYNIIVGTDSERHHEHEVDFVTAIVVHRVGNGGRYFWRHIAGNNIHTLRERMWHEVLISLDVSKELALLLRNAGLQHCHFEIHVDVGENGETRTMIQELVGAIRANNFEAKTKPDSYAASKVADRHV